MNRDVLRKILVLAVLATPPLASAQPAPVADHHQHVFSPELAQLLKDSPGFRPIDAKDVIGLLDAAGIRKAVLLSAGYIHSGAGRNFPDEYARVRADNDWTGVQAALYPERLKAFCGINPLKDWALDEIARCARNPMLRDGIKLHFGNSDVQLENPMHLDRVRRVFRAANDRRMSIVVHMRASISRKRPYGAAQARLFVEQVLAAAPDVAVQVAHMAGSGPGFEDPPAQEVLGALADAVQKGHPATANLWFDVASIVHPGAPPATLALIARRIRQIGAGRILYGTDSAAGDNLRPRESWAAFRRLPLEPGEFATIAANVAPYFDPR